MSKKNHDRRDRHNDRHARGADHAKKPAGDNGTESNRADHGDGHRADESRREDIRGVLISVAGGRLLLPNASIAEVLSYADPEPIADTPDWLLGRIRWRGWQLPLVAFSRLAGLGGEQAGLGSKVVVLKAFGGDPKFPYFALLTQGFPRLVTVTHAGLIADDNADGPAPSGVRARIVLNEDTALLPDLEGLETMIGEALSAA